MGNFLPCVLVDLGDMRRHHELFPLHDVHTLPHLHQTPPTIIYAREKKKAYSFRDSADI
jgi:hypothetical protein